ncbi:MAG: hypothetical protein FWC40_02950 [Proteobacteria bacterium]|nr:hypothetical protein [Pseudomonadota bacterium]
MKIALLPILIVLMTFPAAASVAYAQASPPPKTFQRDALTDSNAKNALRATLTKAVFIVIARQPPPHPLASTGTTFDGACIAIMPPQHLLPQPSLPPQPPPSAAPSPRNSTSFFGQGLDRATSPFAAPPSTPQTAHAPPQQYYLTTADWLTLSETIDIIIEGKPHRATLILRDEAQNVALLATAPVPGIQPLPLRAVDSTPPRHVYALLSPGTRHEAFSEHILSLPAAHLYASTNMTARNGYPLVDAAGAVTGLVVGPNTTRTSAHVVHYGLIDRALNPDNYSRSTLQRQDLIIYP